MEQHEIFMRQAIALAKKGAESPKGGAFGAVIVCDGKVMVAVHNTVKGSGDCTQHAETKAIREACRLVGKNNLSNCELYTSCEPCMMCLGACYWAGFKTIYFGASALDAKEYGYIYSKMFYNSSATERHQEFNMKQLLRDEAIAVWKK